jgi:hypothetical protein
MKLAYLYAASVTSGMPFRDKIEPILTFNLEEMWRKDSKKYEVEAIL